MSNEERQWITVQDTREVLKQHFPEYLSGSCLCGQPINTYVAWIEHVAASLGESALTDEQVRMMTEPSTSANEDESSDDTDL